ncbi:eukaryotic and archaeal DNA primase, large subunit-domain-containing protein [Limtongia smithiae]|uniref:eukaryotic and archaeal DNA primase, large subunit-domain-containing protein n=1 Tax=Limtongia smithiae TaxID=1125753 RepID=UPI0034CD2D81
MFRAQKRRVVSRSNVNLGAEVGREQNYPQRLNLYLTPPLLEITLDQFEEWAIDRLRVLSEIETCIFSNRTFKQIEASIKPLLDEYLPLAPNSSTKSSKLLDDERRKDHYSHFILRLAFCRSEELRRRFVKAESILFRLRYTTADVSEQHALLSQHDFGWTQVLEDEKQELHDAFIFATDTAAAPSEKSVTGESYFKVPFERVPELIENRRVLLKNGDAYVPSSLQFSLVLSEFSEHLDRALETTARALPRLDEDDRLVPILNQLSRGFIAPEYNPENTSSDFGANGAIRAEQVDALVQHFPLCMRSMHQALRRDNHLKYFGRLQYGLFLKGIGLSVEESLQFWRQSFAATTGEDKFNKEYRYNIRHNYGLEGSRNNYRPQGCQQLLNSSAPGPNDIHGCPYRFFSEDHLSSALGELGIRDRGMLSQIKIDVDNKQYHVACTRVFEATHKMLPHVKMTVGTGVGMESITHPNLYFDRSLRMARESKAAEKVEG